MPLGESVVFFPIQICEEPAVDDVALSHRFGFRSLCMRRTMSLSVNVNDSQAIAQRA